MVVSIVTARNTFLFRRNQIDEAQHSVLIWEKSHRVARLVERYTYLLIR